VGPLTAPSEEFLFVKGQVWFLQCDDISKLPKKVIYTPTSKIAWIDKSAEGRVDCVNVSHDPVSGERFTDHAYGATVPEGLRFGGDRIIVNSPHDIEIDADSLQRNMDFAKKIYPPEVAQHFSMETCGYWAKAMAFTKSGRPVSQPLAEGLWFIGAFGPKGIMMGPAYAQHLATRILDKLDGKTSSSNAQVYEDAVFVVRK